MNMKVIFSGIKYPAEALKEFRPVWDLNLLAQLVEHCTSIKEINGFESHIGLNIFFWLYCHCCLSSVYFCKDRFHVHLSYLLLLIRQGKTGFIFQLKILLFFITLEEVHWKRQLIT